MQHKAINSFEFSSIMDSFENFPHIGVCVSGGPDSIALLFLASQWIKKKKGKITAIHFNHNLRKESTNESHFVKNFSNKLDISCKILDWAGPKPKTKIMELAREERYQSIINYCLRYKIVHLMTAHHSDDVLETYLMRLRRSYTTLGLSSIPKIKYHDSLQIIRPLINCQKTRLIDTCISNGLDFVNDKSNKNLKFERVRIRNEISKYSFTKLLSIRNKIKKKILENTNVEKNITSFFLQNIEFLEYGLFRINKNEFLKLTESLRTEILKKILTTCSGKIFPPRSNSLFFFQKKIKIVKNFFYTIHSCCLEIDEKNISFFRESSFTHKRMFAGIIIKKNQLGFWDDRFKIFSKKKEIVCEVINEKNWLLQKNEFFSKKNELKLSFKILKTLPLIYFGKKKLIPFLSSKSVLKNCGIEMLFSPAIPLTKKNFFKY